MATPKIPALLDPAAYALTLTPGTYADLVAGTLGPYGDPSDGFDAAHSQLAQLSQSFRDSLPALDQDLIALGNSAAYFDANPAGDLGAQLQPARDSLNSDLAAFQGIVAPTPNTGGGGTGSAGGGGLGQPSVVQPGDFAGYTPDVVTHALVTSVGAADQQFNYNAFAVTKLFYFWDDLNLIAGDPQTFSTHFASDPNGLSTSPGTPVGNLFVTPATVGHFWAIFYFHPLGAPGPGTVIGVVVDVLP